MADCGGINDGLPQALYFFLSTGFLGMKLIEKFMDYNFNIIHEKNKRKAYKRIGRAKYK